MFTWFFVYYIAQLLLLLLWYYACITITTDIITTRQLPLTLLPLEVEYIAPIKQSSLPLPAGKYLLRHGFIGIVLREMYIYYLKYDNFLLIKSLAEQGPTFIL